MFYATMLIFVVGCVGLAVDVGTIYMIKSRLSSAADAAALAAGRSVNLTNTVAQATINAGNTASQFFAANFPSGYFNSMGTPTVTPNLTQEADENGNPSGVVDIRVSVGDSMVMVASRPSLVMAPSRVRVCQCPAGVPSRTRSPWGARP